MPKYEVLYEKNKLKTIRASSLEIAEERAAKLETNGWVINRITEQSK